MVSTAICANGIAIGTTEACTGCADNVGIADTVGTHGCVSHKYRNLSLHRLTGWWLSCGKRSKSFDHSILASNSDMKWMRASSSAVEKRLTLRRRLPTPALRVMPAVDGNIIGRERPSIKSCTVLNKTVQDASQIEPSNK